MRLISLTVRNYRIHKSLTLDFDPFRTLIGGPNESGKSTLAEAAHRALFLRAKTGGKLHREMLSPHPGDPEVLLTFEAGGSRWELEKHFRGAARGSTRLTPAAGTTLRDDEAETKLAEILHCDAAAGRLNANQLSAVWSHLWVWQGSSGTDPSGHASEHKDTLVQRLQQDGLAAVMQSASDQRIRERVAATYDELFTATGKPKAGSPPEIARAALAEAEAALDRATQTAARLDEAAATHTRAEREIAEATAALPELRKAHETTTAALAAVEKLRAEETTARAALETTTQTHKQLVANDAAIRDLISQSTAAAGALEPADHAEATLAAAEKSARDAAQSAEQSHRTAADAVRACRLRHDFATATVTAAEKAAAHQQLAARATEAAAIRQEISTHHESLAKLPPLSAKDLENLRQLDRAASRDAAALDAMATGIELLAANLAVTLGGLPLAPGDSRILTDSTELSIGSGTRLRIRPGGGGSLADARRQRENSDRALAAALEKLTLRDLDHATAVLQQRQTLAPQIAQLETRWKSLGGVTLAADLATAATARDAAQAEADRRRAALADDAKPISPETARQSLDAAETAETTARRQAANHRAAHESAAAALATQRETTAQARQSHRDLETKLQVLQTLHGQAPARQAAITTAAAEKSLAAAALDTTQKSLADLSPDLLAADLARFNRAISQQETQRREAEDRRLTARAHLTLDGSTDPHAELSHCRARHAAAVDSHASHQRRADAIALLHRLFSDSREAIDRSLVQPLADRISGYLQCLFGPGAEARVTLADTGIQGLELLRDDGSLYEFAALSGGAREQVAAAVRLAMAEILAAGHDGTLPILFDDAFAFTDPDRVRSLQRMLDLAATRGLQVIVLTCTPADYSAFGATEVRMQKMQ